MMPAELFAHPNPDCSGGGQGLPIPFGAEIPANSVSAPKRLQTYLSKTLHPAKYAGMQGGLTYEAFLMDKFL